MSTIAIEGMEFYSYHGHFEEEAIIGTKFILDLFFETNTESAEYSDDIEETVNYLTVYQCVKKEMEKSSYLIENVARRILDTVMKEFPNISKAKIKFRKMNPPLGGQINNVNIVLKAYR